MIRERLVFKKVPVPDREKLRKQVGDARWFRAFNYHLGPSVFNDAKEPKTIEAELSDGTRLDLPVFQPSGDYLEGAKEFTFAAVKIIHQAHNAKGL